MTWEKKKEADKPGVVEYLKKYREDRGKGLNNEEPLRWFSSEVDTMSELIDEVFGRDDENAAWNEEYQKKGKILNLQASALKVSFMAGMVRDLRTLFAAGDENRPRTAADHDRMEYMQCGFHLAKIDQLRNIIKAMEK